MTMILDGTNGEVFPTWTTATRPASPVTSQTGWNTTIGSLENYNGSAWTAVGGGGAGQWQSVQASNFTAVSGNAYAVNTTSAAITVTLPASPSAGNYIQLVDYARTWSTNNVTLNPNGLKIAGSTSNVVLNQSGQGVAIVYIDSTQGWLCYSQGSNIGQYTSNYLVVAGGGSGSSGGGGAGGLLTSTLTLTAGTAYTITVGAGGAAPSSGVGVNGSNSAISGIATAIGGGGAENAGSGNGGNGGSGGGGSSSGNTTFGGSGTSGQGNAGSGNNSWYAPNYPAGGGGGAGGAAGSAGSSSGGNGGIGSSSGISGASTYYAGGGGGGVYQSGGTAGTGGNGGGGTGGTIGGTPNNQNGANASANSGGGGGGKAASGSGAVPGSGGSGVVIISYLGAQRATGGTVTTSGGYTIHTFTTSGVYIA